MATGKRRRNPKTRKLFKRGDVRDDGYIFQNYKMRIPIKKDGYFCESWVNPETLSTALEESSR